MYHYVIIGAGSAGCVLAARLSQNSNNNVLLLEAGGVDSKQEIQIPAAFPKLFKSSVDWAYNTEPQQYLNNRKLFWPRGKVLGGSSSINAMIYIRGNKNDYDEWSRLGNIGWSFNEVLPYFKKSQNQERGPSEYHGVGGPLNVADLRHKNILSSAFINACGQVDYKRVYDFNSQTQEGVGFFQVTQKNGKRHSAAAAYLTPILKRPNLTVKTKCLVKRILFHGTRASGVEYIKDGKTEKVEVSKEVLLCGGTVNSPQLLLLSGIGPKKDLEEKGIQPIVDLPGVGQNLQDHLLVSVAYSCKKPVAFVPTKAETPGNIANFLIFKKGPLTSNIAEAGGFIRTDHQLQYPDIQLMFGPLYFLNHGFTMPPGHGFTIAVNLLSPKSRGSISLRDSNPKSAPLIQPNYLSEEEDMMSLVRAVKIARKIADTKVFEPYKGDEFVPTTKIQSDSDISEYIKNTVETEYHPVGTCKMGVDLMAVVDPELNVYKTQGLRVVDASIIPVITRGNTNAPTIMIAEKAADLILKNK